MSIFFSSDCQSSCNFIILLQFESDSEATTEDEKYGAYTTTENKYRGYKDEATRQSNFVL